MADETTYVLVRDHAEILASGASIGPGDRVTTADLGDDDAYLVEEGALVDVAQFEPTAEERKAAEASAGEALMQRARDLNIDGRSKMSADELRQAVADAEAAGGEA